MTLRTLLNRYRKDENGTLTVEAVILLPILLLMFIAMFVLFDYFRAHSVAGKTAYTVGDMISRETDYITPTYLNGAMNLVEFMNNSDAAGLRVSVISYDDSNDTLNLEWSETAGTGFSAFSGDEINGLRDQVPNMPAGLHMIVVETVNDYDAIFDIGLTNNRIETFVTTIPRFVPQVLWQS